VKEPLKLPFVFLFILLCVILVLSALSVVASWGLTDSTSGSFNLGSIIQRLPRAAFEALIPSVVASIVLLGFRMARRPFSRLLSFLLVLAAGYIVLVNGMIWLAALSSIEKPAAAGAARYLQPRTFVRLGDAVLAPATVRDDNLAGVLLYDPSLPQGKLTVYPSGTVSVQGGRLVVTLVGEDQRQVSGEPVLAHSAVFAPDALTSLFFRDITTLTGDFQRLMTRALPEFFAACFALVFLCAASLVILRLTRWPLANIMLLLTAVRGYFLLYHVLATRFTATVAGALTDPAIARLFPSAVFFILGVILLLVDVLFVPADRWTRTEPA